MNFVLHTAVMYCVYVSKNSEKCIPTRTVEIGAKRKRLLLQVVPLGLTNLTELTLCKIKIPEKLLLSNSNKKGK